MSCRDVRRRLTAGEDARVAAHLAACSACAAYAERLERVREALAGRGAEILPDAGFAARVVARLPTRTELLGSTAARFLPATLALALVLGAWCWWATPRPGLLFEAAPSDDAVAWVLEAAE